MEIPSGQRKPQPTEAETFQIQQNHPEDMSCATWF
jgi:hypothetical protein